MRERGLDNTDRERQGSWPLGRILPLVVGLAFFLATQAYCEPLELESKIPLGNVGGRIDHFAADLSRQRIFVAELGNDSVGVIDPGGRKVIRTITGLNEPQGVGFAATSDTLYLANARDGSVHLFQGGELASIQQADWRTAAPGHPPNAQSALDRDGDRLLVRDLVGLETMHLDAVPPDVRLVVGITATVEIHPKSAE